MTKEKNWSIFAIIALAVLPFFVLFFSLRTNQEENSSEPSKNQVLDQIAADQQKPKTPETMSFIELVNEGNKFYNNGDPRTALSFFLKAKGKEVQSAVLYSNICAAYNGILEYANAVEYCNMALRLEPNFELAKNNLKYAESKIKELTPLQ